MIARTPRFTPGNLATAATRYIRNLTTALWRPAGGWSPPPVLVVLNPTRRCNLRCRFCFERARPMATAALGTEPEDGELTVENYERLIDSLARDRPTFYVTGGEPLLSDRTLPILHAIKSRGLYVSLNTNGVLLAERAKELVAVGLDKVIVSIDGPPEVHNRLRGDSFDALTRGLEALGREKKAADTELPYVRAQCMISPHNIGDLYATAETVNTLGIRELRFQHLMFAASRDALSVDPVTRSLALRADVSMPVVDPGDVDMDRLERDMHRLAARPKEKPLIRYEPDIPAGRIAAYYSPDPPLFGNDCLSAWRRLVVSPYGELGPCQGIYLDRYPKTTVAEAWNGDRFRRFRRQVRQNGLFSYCTRCCHREYGAPRVGLGVS